MNIIEGLMLCTFIIGGLYITNIMIYNSTGVSYQFIEHQDYELKYLESQQEIISLNNKLDESEDKLSYCEEYKNIRTDWSGISIWISGAVFCIIGFVYMQKQTKVK